MDSIFAKHFAADWIAAWNAHDLDRVLAHYTDDFTMHSPIIQQIMELADGKLTGKPAVAAYWRRALTLMPELHFELVCTLVGTHSITLHYKSSSGKLAAEVLHFNELGLVHTAFAHYSA